MAGKWDVASAIPQEDGTARFGCIIRTRTGIIPALIASGIALFNLHFCAICPVERVEVVPPCVPTPQPSSCGRIAPKVGALMQRRWW